MHCEDTYGNMYALHICVYRINYYAHRLSVAVILIQKYATKVKQNTISVDICHRRTRRQWITRKQDNDIHDIYDDLNKFICLLLTALCI